MSKGFLATNMIKAKRIGIEHDRTPEQSETDKSKSTLPKAVKAKKKKKKSTSEAPEIVKVDSKLQQIMNEKLEQKYMEEL